MDIDKLILKFSWRGTRPKMVDTIWKNKAEGPMLLNF